MLRGRRPTIVASVAFQEDQKLFVDACIEGDLDQAEGLLSRYAHEQHVLGALLTARIGPSKMAPLHVAVQNNKIAVVEALVCRWNADVDIRDNDGRTPLHLAASCGHLSLVESLVLVCRANVEAVDNKHQSPLFYAAEAGCTEAVVFLVESGGANINVKSNIGFTPLHVAVSLGRVHVASFLAQLNSNPKLIKVDNSR